MNDFETLSSTLNTLMVKLNDTQSLNVITFNLGFSIQRNDSRKKCSEQPMVLRCQKTYGSGPLQHGLAPCTRNAADGMLSFFQPRQPDLIGLQESDAQSTTNLVRYLQKFASQPVEFRRIGREVCSIIYNRLTMGPGHPFFLTAPGLRGGCGVYFPKRNLIFHSLWLDHGTDLHQLLRQFKLPHGVTAGFRVVVALDSNDDQTWFGRGSGLQIYGVTVQHPGSAPDRTCCEDSGYTYPGDYILDSQPWRTLEYGVPSSLDPQTQLMSDHLPVILRSR